MEVTPEERKFIRSALGLDNPDARGTGYRNRYFAGADDVPIGDALVKKALAIRLDGDGFDGLPLFKITTAGFRAVAKKGETMDREETVDMHRWDQRAFRGT